ncbi:MAG: leucine-rich repeat protein [Acetobacter sp.]|nr:leucine-rich repeat protein [Bacteroides sp.]MCM1341925.1 leucine-rich repeat protein [Acetobacter sp.]MCM1434109.1 leucine-rich repeat protein [Clostridiales bacterium]
MKQTKKLLSVFLSVVMLLSITSGLDLSAYAQVYSGTCGTSVSWTLDTDTGVLTISGRGNMRDYDYRRYVPWYDLRFEIKIVDIKSGVTSIGRYAFNECSSLTSVIIPKGVTSIDGGAFYDCSSLKSVTIPEGVTDIGVNVFAYCTSLTSVTIPDSVASINEKAFAGCTSLTSVTIPDSVASINEKAFAGCTSLTGITIPDSVASIGEKAFADCTSLTNVIIGNGVKSIESAQFFNCNSLKSITIGSGVSSIDSSFYGSFPNLARIDVDNKNPYFSSEDGILFNKKKTILLNYCPAKKSKSYKIPNSVTSIGIYAFMDNGNLTSISIPDSVTEIGIRAFLDCKQLESVSIGKGIEHISCEAFKNAEKLKKVKIQGSSTQITEICGEAFRGCTEIEELTMPTSSYYNFGSCQRGCFTDAFFPFNDCLKIKKITLTSGFGPKIYGAVGECKNGYNYRSPYTNFYNPWYLSRNTLEELVIEEGVESIEPYAIDLVKENNNIEAVGYTDNCCFTACRVLKKITFKDTDTYINQSVSAIPRNTVIYGYRNSTAREYAQKYSRKFVCLDHSYKDKVVTKATTSKNGKLTLTCSVCGAVKTNTTIYSAKTITLSATSYTYDGKAKKPSVTVKDSKGNKISSSNYTVTYASGRKNVGKYTVKITFKGNYSGTVTKTFTIKPKATSISKLTADKKKFTVKWKKQATQTTGYEIQYATDSKFTKNKKTVTVSKNSTTSKTISKLKAKKKYYVRIRTYKTVKVNGKNTKIYSSWSKAKTVTTKK